MLSDSSAPIRLLGISGSLRRESHSTAVLRTLAGKLGEGVELSLFPLHDIPLYNQDDDTGDGPRAVLALRRAIAASDGLVIVSPEYNHGAPGVLRNALDWASRPHGKSPLIGEPVVIMTASPAFTGGVRAQAELIGLLSACQMRVVPRPQVVISGSHEKIKDGRLVDAAALAFSLEAIDDLLKEIALLRLARNE